MFLRSLLADTWLVSRIRAMVTRAVSGSWHSRALLPVVTASERKHWNAGFGGLFTQVPSCRKSAPCVCEYVNHFVHTSLQVTWTSKSPDDLGVLCNTELPDLCIFPFVSIVFLGAVFRGTCEKCRFLSLLQTRWVRIPGVGPGV